MTAEDESVCRQLDELTLRMLELMEEQLHSSNRIAVTMKRGFIDIAKARYIMGNRNLSTLQLPGDNSPQFTALSTVKLEAEKDEGPKFVINTVTKTKLKDKAAGGEELRNRADGNKSIKHRDDIPQETTRIGDGPEEETIKTVDPLRWFGLLVPQNLRLAQSGFSSTVDLVTQSVNIQLELEATRSRYSELRERRTCTQTQVGEQVQVSQRNGSSKKKNKNTKT